MARTPFRKASAAFTLVLASVLAASCSNPGAEPDGAVDPNGSGLAVAAPAHRTYSRDAFGSGWTDSDGDCLDTRAEVLIAASSARPSLAKTGCSVVSGRWRDAYTGATVTDARSLDIDHVVPLAEAWRSGAWRWTDARRSAFANETNKELLPVSASLNRSKGDQDPAEWMPPNPAARCAYVRRWVAIKVKWGLSVDRRELGAINRTLGSC